MPLYTGDYLRDTPHLSCSENGIYIKLLMYCWDQKGPAPTDERRLCGIVNARSGDEVEALRRILHEFFVLMDDGWYNKRMSEVIAEAERISGCRRRGGLEKARKQRDIIRAQVMLEQNSSNAPPGNPNPNPNPNLNPEDLSSPTIKNIVGEEVVIAEEAQRKRPALPPCPIEKIIEAYHSILPMCRPTMIRNKTRDGYIRQRWKERPDLDYWRRYFQRVSESNFLCGRVRPSPGRPPFEASLEWLMRPNNYANVVEGKYHE